MSKNKNPHLGQTKYKLIDNPSSGILFFGTDMILPYNNN
jgi:hypothetical protein